MTRDNANVAGDIRYAGDRIADASNCINNVPVRNFDSSTSGFHPSAASEFFCRDRPLNPIAGHLSGIELLTQPGDRFCLSNMGNTQGAAG